MLQDKPEDWENHHLLLLNEYASMLWKCSKATRDRVLQFKGNYRDYCKVILEAIEEATAKATADGDFAKIAVCEIREGDSRGYMEVHAKFDNGTEKVVATYFADELSFYPEEFIGLTKRQASDLHTRKDLSYLRS